MQGMVNQLKVQLNDVKFNVNETKKLSLVQAEIGRMQSVASSMQVETFSLIPGI